MAVNAERLGPRPLDGRVAIVTGRLERARRAVRHRARRGRRAGRRLRAPARAGSRSSPRADAAIHPLRCDVHGRGRPRSSSSGPRSSASAASTCCVNNAGMSSGGPERQSELQTLPGRPPRQPRVGLRASASSSSEPMRRQGSGSVINISSMFGQVASMPVPDAGYVASKAAVNGLTRELANQWARRRHPRQRDRTGLVPDRDERRARSRTSARGDGSSAQCPMGRPGRERRARRRAPLPRVGRVVVLHRPGDRRRRRVDDPMSAARRTSGRPSPDRRRPADGAGSRRSSPT